MLEQVVAPWRRWRSLMRHSHSYLFSVHSVLAQLQEVVKTIRRLQLKAGVLGLEPRKTEPESVVMPFHYTPVKLVLLAFVREF